jgi:hypothetical protein
MKAFGDALNTIENDYNKALHEIELEHQSNETYTSVLEKEMSTALKELEHLVDEGKNIISKEITKNKLLLENNLKSFKINLEKLENKAQQSIEESLYLISENYQISINILHLLELVENNGNSLHSELITIMSYFHEKASKQLGQQQQLTLAPSSSSSSSTQQLEENRLFIQSRQSNGGSRTTLSLQQLQQETAARMIPKFAFQSINNNTVEYHLLACMIDPLMLPYYKQDGKDSSSSDGEKLASGLTPKRIRSNSGIALKDGEEERNSTDSGNEEFIDIPLLELAKLYKIAFYPRPFSINSATLSPLEYQRVYCVMTYPELKILLMKGWKGLQASYQNDSSSSTNGKGLNLNFGKISQVFSNDAGKTICLRSLFCLLACFFSCLSRVFCS